MSSSLPGEMELMKKHEEILGRRAELLEQMENHREQLKVQRRQLDEASEAACLRNSVLLQDLWEVEDRLRGRQLPPPSLLALETRYWVSVEESIPAWEHFLLGKGPHHSHSPGPTPRRAKPKASLAKDQGLPPRPKPRMAPSVSGNAEHATGVSFRRSGATS